jgi:hypothetical protein
MNLKDQFISAFDSILLALLMVWTATVVSALVYPQVAATERAGTVEIYALARADGPGA